MRRKKQKKRRQFDEQDKRRSMKKELRRRRDRIESSRKRDIHEKYETCHGLGLDYLGQTDSDGFVQDVKRYADKRGLTGRERDAGRKMDMRRRME